MELRDAVKALRASWWLVTLCVLLGLGSAVAFILLTTPLYTSGSRLFVASTSSDSTAEALQGSQLSEQRIASYARLLSDESLTARVVESLRLDVTPEELADQVSAQPVADTVLLDYTVTDESPKRAQAIATELGRQFVDFVEALETPDARARPPVKVSVLRTPDRPDSPSWPPPTGSLLLGGVAGSLLGVGSALARTRLDRTIKNAEQVTALVDAPLIGVISRDPAVASAHVFERDASNPAAEGYRRLRTNLQFVHVDEPPKVILVSSAIPAEGKTTLAINLSLALTEAGHQVVLVDGDLRRPKVARYLGLIEGVGLTQLLSEQADIGEVLQHYRSDALAVIGAGPRPPNPSQLLASSQMSSLMNDLAAKHDYVIIDSPPILPVADVTNLAAGGVDGVVLAVRYGSTRRELLKRAVETLDQVGGRTLGVVINIVPPRADVSEGYGYQYE